MIRKRSTAGRPWAWPRLLFIVLFLAVLWVPSYNRMEPSLGGVPFFYWYQLLWILLGASLVLAVYLIEAKVGGGKEGAGDIDKSGTPGEIL